MAEFVASAEKLEVVGKSVQELVNYSDNLPMNYIYEEGGVGFRDALLSSDIPVVDLQKLTSPSTAQQELAKLRSALNSWGCFQVRKSLISGNNYITNNKAELENLKIYSSQLLFLI